MSVGSMGNTYSKKIKVKSTFIHNLKNGIHDLHIIILECASSPLESRSRVRLHRIEQISVSSVDLRLAVRFENYFYCPCDIVFFWGGGLFYIY
jgi:hypothetical protein